MASKRKYWAAIFFAALLWGLAPALVMADDPEPQILLAHAEEITTGLGVELAAKVLSGEGEPLEGVNVTFLAELGILNTFDLVAIGEATTDSSGVASLIYIPRTPGEITFVARVGDLEAGDFQEASGTMSVQNGLHLYHSEDLVQQIRARWGWVVQWIWLVILPAGAFSIYMVVMFLLWRISRDGSTSLAPRPRPGEGGLRASRTFQPKRSVLAPLVPIAGGFAILVAASVLVLAITFRPWASADSGWRTEFNLLHSVPDDYTRSIPMEVGDEPSFEEWEPHAGLETTADVEGLPTYVGYGCASCHGLTREGGAVGEDLSDISASDVRKALKKGPEGMPAFPSLSTESVDALMALLTGPEQAVVGKPEPEATPVPAPAPAASLAAPKPTATSAPAPSAESAATPTPAPGPTDSGETPEPEPEPGPTAAPTPEPEPEIGGPVSLQAATAAITVDGDTSDWSDIPTTPVTLQQIKPIRGVDMGQLDPIDVNLRVAMDSERIYLLIEASDDYDYVPDDHGLSAGLAVMFRIDDPAAPHMGSEEENQKKSLGKVDMWHWELDCGPGVMSGGVTGIVGGNDRECNLDDEWATRPKDYEDDGSTQAENSIAGVWEHTARGEGIGAAGTWVFEMSRMLQTGDPDDTQFTSGMTAYLALAYWDADETPDGWTSEGHLQSSSGGWIEVALPASPP